MKLTQFAINRPVTITMIFIGLCLLGIISWNRLPVQLFPEIIFPEVYVSLAYPGASPEKTEKELIIPIEGELGRLENIREISSRAYPGMGAIRVSYEYRVDMKFALLKLQQKVAALERELPLGSRIEIHRFETSDFANFLMQLNVRGDYSEDRLRNIAVRKIQPLLQQVDGVVSVVVGGGRDQSVGIVVDENKCQAHSIPLSLVQQKLDEFNQRTVYLGQIKIQNRAFHVNLVGQFSDLSQIKNLVINEKIPLFLKDVADINHDYLKRTRYYRINRKASVGIFLQKENTANLLAVAKNVQHTIDRINKDLKKDGIELVITVSQAEYIQKAINEVEKLAVIGALLALFVLFLFLRTIRFVIILLLAIPVSLLVTFNFMYFGNLSVNILSLCGLALAIGLLVDNGIVVIESIFSHHERGLDGYHATLRGTSEVGRAIIASTLTTVIVFVSILFVESEAKIILKEFSLSVMIPLLVSLVVALTLIPMLARKSLKIKRPKFHHRGRLIEIYHLFLKSCIRHRVRMTATILVLLLFTLFLSTVLILSHQLTPPHNRFNVYIETPKGSTLNATDYIARQVEELIDRLENVAEIRTDVREQSSTVSVELLSQTEQTNESSIDQIKDKLKREFRKIPRELGKISFENPNQESGSSDGSRVAEGGLFGGSEQEKIRLSGQELDKLKLLSSQLMHAVRSISTVDQRSVSSDMERSTPELQIHPDRKRLVSWGITMRDIMLAIWNVRATGNQTNIPFRSREDEVTIQTKLRDAENRQISELKKITVFTPNNQYIPMGAIADFKIDEGPSVIKRRNQVRQVQIRYAFKKEVLESKLRLEEARKEIDGLVEKIHLPRGYTLEIIHEEDKTSVYYWIIGIGAILIYMLLAAQFESLTSPIIILCTIPPAIIGSMWMLILSGTPLSLGQGAPMALLGLIVLLGIVVNDGIILLDLISVLRNKYNYRWQRAILRAGQIRIRPILMTSATTMMGVFPLALKSGEEFEIWPPFALVVLGGLGVATLTTPIFIPLMYVAIEQIKIWLKKIGILGNLLGLTLTTLSIYLFHQYYQSTFWTVIGALPIWFSWLGIIWFIKWLWKTRYEVLIQQDEELTIRIKNLTKIYDLPGRFRLEWSKEKRRHSRIFKMRLLPWKREDLRETFIWKGCILGLAIYLHTFIESDFWITMLTIFTWLWLFLMIRDLRKWFQIFNHERGSTANIEKWTRWLCHFISISAIIYEHLRNRDVVGTVLITVIWLVGVMIRRTSQKIRNGQINPELPAGKFRRIKWLYYWIICKLPLLGPGKKQVWALHGVDLEIGKGMYGLLGPNGAGKTTLMRIIVGVLRETRGSISINGRSLMEHRAGFHGHIGYLPQDCGLYGNMTAWDYLQYHALINGQKNPIARNQLVTETIRSVGLYERRHEKLKNYSGGMKQRIGIAQTLLNLPKIIVVDEPTAGLDPRERIRFRNLLSELSKERIVVFSTHIVEDILSTCQMVSVLNHGRILYTGSPLALRESAQGKVWEAIVAKEKFDSIKSSISIISHAKQDSQIRIRYLADRDEIIAGSKDVPPTLEDAYLHLLGGDVAVQ